MSLTKIGSIGINTGIQFAGVTTVSTLHVGSGVTLSSDGDGFFTGVITATSYSGIDLSDVTGATGDFSIADKIIHTGDTNTALRFPAADTVSVETAGVERVEITGTEVVFNDTGTDTDFRIEGDSDTNLFKLDAGNDRIGIGEASPDVKLHVRNDNSAAVKIGGEGGSAYYMEIGQLASSGSPGFNATGSGASMLFQMAGSEKLRIGPSGQIGIGGATYGSSGQVLTSGGSSGAVSWTTISGTTINNNANNRVITGSGTADTLEGESSFTYDGNGMIDIEGTGAAGIQIKTPNNTDGGVYYRTGSSNPGAVTYQHSDNSMRFRVNSTEKLRIDSSGRVLIGTTTEGESTADDLTIANSGSCGITIRSGTDSEGNIFFSDGTSGDAEYRGTIQYNQNDDRFVFFTAGTERMRIDSDGEMAFTAQKNGQIIYQFKNTDTTSSSYAMTLEHHFNFNRTGGGMNSSAAKIIAGKEREWIGGASNQDGYLAFHTLENESSGEKMRLGSHNIFLHSTSSSGSNGRIYTNNAGANHCTLEINQNSGSGTEMMAFRNGGTQIGSITQSSSNTSYNTGSDYRLKENDVAISDGITRLKQLRPIRFNWKTDPSTTQDGFFAHEVQTVVPESVRGNKDEVFDTDGVGTQKKGGIKIQQLDHSKLVPLLTAALKEAITEIETLKTKVAALEGS